MKWIGKDYKGDKITGVAGPYLNEDANPYIAKAEKVNNILIDKSIFMNKTTDGLRGEYDLSPQSIHPGWF